MNWSSPFDEPIKLADGRKLVTLKDAGSLDPGRDGGPTMFARIGVMRALNRRHVREFNTDRKPHHWGKRKLKRDQ